MVKALKQSKTNAWDPRLLAKKCASALSRAAGSVTLFFDQFSTRSYRLLGNLRP